MTGMYALRERRQHVTQEDFEFAVAKVRWAIDVLNFVADADISVCRC
jgi:ATP-dependent 26S proteasome regulatory subunit